MCTVYLSTYARAHTAHVYMWIVSYTFCTWCLCVGVWKMPFFVYLFMAIALHSIPEIHTPWNAYTLGIFSYVCLNMYVNIHTYMPLTEEIRLKIFGSPDLSVFLIDLLTGGDSIYSRENSFEMFGTPVKMCLICTGTSVKSCWMFWQ